MPQRANEQRKVQVCLAAIRDDEIVRLLRAAVEREGGQTAFARRHRLDRTRINRILNGKLEVHGPIAKVLGLRKVYIAE
jgi:hypothetical protein